STGTGEVARKPLMSGRALLMMNLGFFGVQFSFGLTQSAVNPLFLLIGASPGLLPILNLAGPVTGLIIQPLIGAISDRTWSPRWGRRRPFITAGAILCAIILFLFPFVGALWLAVICFWLLDAGITTAMARTKELTPSDEALQEMRATPRGARNAVRDIRDAVKTMPIAMHKIGIVFFFQWYAMFIYWQFLAVSLGETVFHTTPERGGPAWQSAIAWSGLENGAYNFVTMISALFLVGFCVRIGAKRVHAIALGLAAVALISLAHALAR